MVGINLPPISIGILYHSKDFKNFTADSIFVKSSDCLWKVSTSRRNRISVKTDFLYFLMTWLSGSLVRDFINGGIFGHYRERTSFLRGHKEELQVDWENGRLPADGIFCRFFS